MAKALIGTLWAFLHKTSIHDKSVSALTRYRGREIALLMISDVHAISANNHNYQYQQI